MKTTKEIISNISENVLIVLYLFIFVIAILASRVCSFCEKIKDSIIVFFNKIVGKTSPQ